jgi:hypothetical protein
MENTRTVKIDGALIEFRGDRSLAPIALRVFAGMTPIDAQVDALPLPRESRVLRFCVEVVRWYRTIFHRILAEDVFLTQPALDTRNSPFDARGIFMGLVLTLRRVHRCRPGAGGIDIP